MNALNNVVNTTPPQDPSRLSTLTHDVTGQNKRKKNGFTPF